MLGKNGENIYNSTFAEHLKQTNHKPQPLDKLVALQFAEKGMKLNFLEELEIYKHSLNDNGSLLNEQIFLKNKSFLDSVKKIITLD